MEPQEGQGLQPGQQMGLTPQSQMMEANNMPNPAGPASGGVLPLVNRRTATQVLQQLLTTLKSSNFPQQKQQALSILKSNPQLMAAFIKQRSRQPQQQQAASLTFSEIMAMGDLQMMGANVPNPAGPAPGGAVLPLVNPGTLAPETMAPEATAPGTSAPGTSMQQNSNAQVLQQLLSSLKSSNLPQQKQEVLTLKLNPQLMETFIEQRSRDSKQQKQQIRNSLHKVEIGLATKTATSDEQIDDDDQSVPPPDAEPCPYPSAEPESCPSPLVEPEPESCPSPLAEPEPESCPSPLAEPEPESCPSPLAEPEPCPSPLAEPVPESCPYPPEAPISKVLQQMLTSLKSSSNFSQQKQQVLSILKSNPQLMAAYIKERSRQQQAASSTLSEIMAMGDLQKMGTNNMPNPAGLAPGGAVLPLVNPGTLAPEAMAPEATHPGTSAPGTSMQQNSNAQVLQQLLSSLKSSNLPQQKQEVLTLKLNPQLMETFIEQRSRDSKQQILNSLHKVEIGLATKTATSDEQIDDDDQPVPPPDAEPCPYPPAEPEPESCPSPLAEPESCPSPLAEPEPCPSPLAEPESCPYPPEAPAP